MSSVRNGCCASRQGHSDRKRTAPRCNPQASLPPGSCSRIASSRNERSTPAPAHACRLSKAPHDGKCRTPASSSWTSDSRNPSLRSATLANSLSTWTLTTPPAANRLSAASALTLSFPPFRTRSRTPNKPESAQSSTLVSKSGRTTFSRVHAQLADQSGSRAAADPGTCGSGRARGKQHIGVQEAVGRTTFSRSSASGARLSSKAPSLAMRTSTSAPSTSPSASTTAAGIRTARLLPHLAICIRRPHLDIRSKDCISSKRYRLHRDGAATAVDVAGVPAVRPVAGQGPAAPSLVLKKRRKFRLKPITTAIALVAAAAAMNKSGTF